MYGAKFSRVAKFRVRGRSSEWRHRMQKRENEFIAQSNFFEASPLPMHAATRSAAKYTDQPSTLMSLTYQPFAKLPEIEALSDELKMNVPDEERLYSGIAGLSLCALGMAFPRGFKWLFLGLGAALIHRGTSGHCPWYTHRLRDKRHYPAN
jgi:DUF2892 family protein